MPSATVHGGRRTQIPIWRVKAGKKDIFGSTRKFDCEIFIRDNKGKLDGVKLRLIPPNK